RARTAQHARHGDTDSWGEIVEPPPAVEREELVIPGGSDRVAESCREAIHRLRARGERVRHRPSLEPPRRRLRGEDTEAAATDELANRTVDTLVRQKDTSLAGQAARLAKVGEDRTFVVPLLDRARQLRQGDD